MNAADELLAGFGAEQGADAATDAAAETLQLQALLISRAYLYELFHKLLGGTPDGEVLSALTSPVAFDVVEEFGEGNEALSGFGKFLQDLCAAYGQDPEGKLSAVRDEYTRVLMGPAELPASPYESPYTGVHDMSLFQENTLAVRRAFHGQGFAVRREQAVPDDHVALMCALMAQLAQRAEGDLATGDLDTLTQELRWQGKFVRAHMSSWLPVYAEAVRNSKAGAQSVLYPQLLEALAAFVSADAAFLAEAAYWAEGEGAAAELPSFNVEVADPFSEVREALSALQATRPFGIQDNELISLD